MDKEQYQLEYDKFIDNYHRSEISGEEVGEVIARMAQYYSKYNLEMVAKDRAMSMIAKDIESRADENGKAISSSKAQVFLSATPEANDYKISRAHLQNVEQIINALKSLQRGVLNEYSYSNL